MGLQRPFPAAVSKPRLWQGLGPCPHPGGRVGRKLLKQLLSPPQDKGNDGVKELDSLKSDRLRTVQLNVCKSEEVDKVVEIVRSSLEDPEKGKRHLGAAGVAH